MMREALRNKCFRFRHMLITRLSRRLRDAALKRLLLLMIFPNKYASTDTAHSMKCMITSRVPMGRISLK